MINQMSGWALAAGMALAAAFQQTPPPSQPPPPLVPSLKVGDVAPPFTLQGSDGKTHSLSSYKGKTVVLAWFPKAFTGGWTAECKSLRESGENIRKFANVVYFAASVDDAETNKKFAEHVEADYPILSDPEKKVAAAYGVVDAQHQFAARWTFYIGPDGRIKDIDAKVSPRTAGEDVVRKLEELKTPKK